MIEMLGVLAIIGILSVTALYGFYHALMKTRANRIIEDVQLAGFIVRDELFNHLAVAESRPLNGVVQTKTSYSFWAEKESDQSFFVVTEDLSKDLCQELLSRKVQWLEEIHANSLGGVCEADHNNLYFYFNADMNGETALNSKECRVDSDCDASQPHCINGWCRPCVEGEFLIKANNQFQCAACLGVGGRKASFSGSACYTCGDNYYTTEDGVWCAECTNAFSENVTREACARCPNRCYDEETGRCPICS